MMKGKRGRGEKKKGEKEGKLQVGEFRCSGREWGKLEKKRKFLFCFNGSSLKFIYGQLQNRFSDKKRLKIRYLYKNVDLLK